MCRTTGESSKTAKRMMTLCVPLFWKLSVFQEQIMRPFRDHERDENSGHVSRSFCESKLKPKTIEHFVPHLRANRIQNMIGLLHRFLEWTIFLEKNI